MNRIQLFLAAVSITTSPFLLAQSQQFYNGSNATGQLVLSGTSNLLQLAGGAPSVQTSTRSEPGTGSRGGYGPLAARTASSRLGQATESGPEINTTLAPQLLRPPYTERSPGEDRIPTVAGLPVAIARPAFEGPFERQESLPVAGSPAAGGFLGLTHLDQRNANNGNQFSVEPPSPAIAIGNGFILEGVNNAVMVYTTSAKPLLPSPVSSNQLFGLPPAIDRSTPALTRGPFPTDMRVFYDSDINRWFVLQWASLTDTKGNPIFKSTEWLAVSQTSDPTGTYNIYSIDTTDSQNTQWCPCIPDYPLIGADRYAFYISSNEFNIGNQIFADATILAISKAALATGAAAPSTYRFLLPRITGYEASIQPATTPPGGKYYVANGQAEYFVSTQTNIASGSNLAVWAMFNTSSIDGPNPDLILTQIIVPTESYFAPNLATQRPGPLPYGSFLFPPNGFLTLIDGGDTRILSGWYAAGRLYATVACRLQDDQGHQVIGAAYFILSPTFRSGLLAAPVLRQGYISVNNDHLLRSALAVNAQGQGAIAFTLVGPDYYPSAGFVPIDTFSTGSTAQIAGVGVAPEDGFTGYVQGISRWGDNSTATAAADGTIWLGAEYIPNAPRTQLANWGTFVYGMKP